MQGGNKKSPPPAAGRGRGTIAAARKEYELFARSGVVSNTIRIPRCLQRVFGVSKLYTKRQGDLPPDDQARLLLARLNTVLLHYKALPRGVLPSYFQYDAVIGDYRHRELPNPRAALAMAVRRVQSLRIGLGPGSYPVPTELRTLTPGDISSGAYRPRGRDVM